MQHDDDTLANTNYTAAMTANQFKFAQRRYPLLVVRPPLGAATACALPLVVPSPRQPSSAGAAAVSVRGGMHPSATPPQARPA